MAAGTYKTTDPNKRVRLLFDEIPPCDSLDAPFADGVLADLMDCYDSGNYYGAILLERDRWVRVTEDLDGTKTYHDHEDRWTEIESIWGCAGYDNPAEDIAKEFFGVTVTEKI